MLGCSFLVTLLFYASCAWLRWKICRSQSQAVHVFFLWSVSWGNHLRPCTAISLVCCCGRCQHCGCRLGAGARFQACLLKYGSPSEGRGVLALASSRVALVFLICMSYLQVPALPASGRAVRAEDRRTCTTMSDLGTQLELCPVPEN